MRAVELGRRNVPHGVCVLNGPPPSQGMPIWFQQRPSMPVLFRCPFGCRPAVLEQMARLDIEISVDQGGGHVLREDIQHQDPLAFQISQHLAPPIQDLSRRPGPEQAACGQVGRFRCVKQLMVPQQDSEREMASDLRSSGIS